MKNSIKFVLYTVLSTLTANADGLALPFPRSSLYAAREIHSPIVIHGIRAEMDSNGIVDVRVNWTNISDKEFYKVLLVAAFKDHKGNWLQDRQSGGKLMDLEYKGFYPAFKSHWGSSDMGDNFRNWESFQIQILSVVVEYANGKRSPKIDLSNLKSSIAPVVPARR